MELSLGMKALLSTIYSFSNCFPSVGLTLASILSLSINLAKAEGPCPAVLLRTSPSHTPHHS